MSFTNFTIGKSHSFGGTFSWEGHMKKTNILPFALAALMLPAHNAWATHGSLSTGGTGHTGPINTVSALTVAKGLWGVDFMAEYTSFDTFSDTRLLEFAANGESIHNVDSMTSYYLGLTYGLTDNLMFNMKIPYVMRSTIKESEPPDEIHDHGNAEGAGDLDFYFQYRFLGSARDDFQAALFAGLKLPTGRTKIKDSTGTVLDAEFQPGSGSWDPHLGIAVTRKIGRASLDANLLYDLVTEGTQNTDLGDIFSYNVAFSYPAMRGPVGWDLIIEANGLWRQKEEINGEKDPNSGGDVFYISPGTRLTLSKNFSAYLTVGLPLWQDMNGNQNEVNYRVAGGLILTF